MSATTTTGPGKPGLLDPLIPHTRQQNAAYVDSAGDAHAARMDLARDAQVQERSSTIHLASQGAWDAIALGSGVPALPTGTGNAMEEIIHGPGGPLGEEGPKPTTVGVPRSLAPAPAPAQK